MGEKANILVLGTSGAGKSTLINTVIGREVAKVATGSHGTETMEAYESEDLNFRLIDSRGFEYSLLNTRKAVKDIKSWMKAGLKNEKPRIHMLWFCVDATSKRFTKQTIKTVEAVKKEWKEVPVIVVLTKSFFEAEDNDNIAMVYDTFKKMEKKTGSPVAIIPVLAQPPKGDLNIFPRGIEDLIEVTEENLDKAVRDSEEAVYKFDLKLKRRKAQALSVAATTAASVVGAVPIDFPDAFILTPLETGLITAISRVYELDQKQDQTKMLINHIVEAGTISMVAKTAINQLKLIPGIANLAADVLNAIVAGAIVFGIGEAAIIIMEKGFKGELKPEDLDWITNVVEGSMSDMVKKITRLTAGSDGKLSAKDIIMALIGK